MIGLGEPVLHPVLELVAGAAPGKLGKADGGTPHRAHAFTLHIEECLPVRVPWAGEVAAEEHPWMRLGRTSLDRWKAPGPQPGGTVQDVQALQRETTGFSTGEAPGDPRWSTSHPELALLLDPSPSASYGGEDVDRSARRLARNCSPVHARKLARLVDEWALPSISRGR